MRRFATRADPLRDVHAASNEMLCRRIGRLARTLTLATVLAVLSCAVSGQELGVLHIKVTLTDAAHAAVPVPRAALLISDNPATTTPRRVVTAADGTAT